MWGALANLFRVETIRKKIIVTLGLLLAYRVGVQIPLPGVDYSRFFDVVTKQADSGMTQIVGLFNALSAGNFNAPVLFSLGILPYITSSIIFSLLVKVIPSLEALSKEGAAGQKKINQYSRLLTVPICLFQGLAICLATFKGLANEGVFVSWNFGTILMCVLGMTAGTVLLMWIGEQITAHGVGNGSSLLIMSGIVTDVPFAFKAILDRSRKDTSYIVTAAVLFLVYIGIIIAVVYMQKAQRRIPIQQAKLQKGRKMFGGARHYLPFKLNMANVMPVIFANAVITLPMTVVGAIAGSRDTFISSGGWWWIVLEVALIIVFSFFWTSLMFQPNEMANNLKEYGSFVPGIRPGKKTAEFLEYVMVRITLVGAFFLALVAVIPTLISRGLDVDMIVTRFLGGTGIIIVVGVVLDLVDQLNNSLLQRNYEGFMSAASSRRGSRR